VVPVSITAPTDIPGEKIVSTDALEGAVPAPAGGGEPLWAPAVTTVTFGSR
jgi:hypothetical protein